MILFQFCSTKNGRNSFEIIKITDGDTFQINFNGKKEKVRLIGIDTPESRINKKARKDALKSDESVEDIVALGKEATQFVKTLVKVGGEIKIEFDVRERDQYGRLLVYAYLQDGRMLNEVIIKAGYASPLTYPPNVKYQKLFLEAFHFARENKLGLWAD
jgi:micrococcal nuclease